MGNEYSTNEQTAENSDNTIKQNNEKIEQPTDDVKHENMHSNHNNTNTITIVHISDTHDHHNQVILPAGDILIHTGDFCNKATKAEYARFNKFLAKHSSKFPLGIYVILGNHDYKFLDGIDQNEQLIHAMADKQSRKKYFDDLLPNAHIIDNETITIKTETNSLTIHGVPWTPFQSKPTYPEKVPKVGNGHYRVLEQWKKLNNIKANSENVPNFYDQIPDNVDVLLCHIPPYGIFDQMPVYPYPHWGSSSRLLHSISGRKVRCLLFGHVHAQRGYWERVEINDKFKIIGGCEYSKTTDDTRKEGIIHDLMMGKDGKDSNRVQFIANTALMSDRTVQPFAKKKIVGKPRVIKACLKDSKWVFHNAEHE